MIVCTCGCGFELTQAFVDAFVNSKYNAYPHVMWWRSLEMCQVDQDLVEQRVLRGWARFAERLWMKEHFK